MSLNPLTIDDPARVADYGALPGEAQWNSKQLANYERRIERLEEELFTTARTDILRCIRGESEGVVLSLFDGLRFASRSDLLSILNDQLTVEEGLSLWDAPSVDVEQKKKRIIDGLARDVAKARAETIVA
jgi:hypothetical protein